ncbi:MAG: MBL fold metallo-hydrolase, partial [Planctomycetes bacterium]|nr:MBL fold metallo-hydrolase [Planctomycetota bacterium]
MDVETCTRTRWIGPWRVDAVEAGGLSLDGGSMFGSVPRGLWQKRIAPDAEHRIPLAMRLLLLRHRIEDRVVLIDTGIGDKFDATFAERFAVKAPDGESDGTLPLEVALGELGVSLGEVTDVVLTHLHFDHGGGVSRRAATGEVLPTFPTATHYLQRSNLETAERPNSRERA